MLSGNGVKTLLCSYNELYDPLRLTMLSGNGAQDSLSDTSLVYACLAVCWE